MGSSSAAELPYASRTPGVSAHPGWHDTTLTAPVWNAEPLLPLFSAAADEEGVPFASSSARITCPRFAYAYCIWPSNFSTRLFADAVVSTSSGFTTIFPNPGHLVLYIPPLLTKTARGTTLLVQHLAASPTPLTSDSSSDVLSMTGRASLVVK
eukprot:CAMPEP_0178995000 /NCGR_PEP_ID=MMETSP0795-20121207/7599_1 /TAXON_ID=88552 /ORGANISM="Amoebophrya sp., Strain Ameob2" /LENGTH=152 /DNA_ID=CAMNT_0020687289 /DNA_START=299 /DNA_END=760 /DNA_ORIENTATION=-